MKLQFSSLTIPINRENLTQIIVHFIGIVLTIGISSFLVRMFWSSESAIWWGCFGVILLILVSLADFLDIIQLRKTVHRKTKCAICGFTGKSEHYKETSIVTTEKQNEFNNGTEIKTVAELQHSKDLDGIIVKGKVICIDCIKVVKDLSR